MRRNGLNWSDFYSVNNLLKKVLGVLAIIIGLLALVTPFTPGSWLIFVGAEMLGIRLLFLDKVRNYHAKVWSKFKGKKRTDLEPPAG